MSDASPPIRGNHEVPLVVLRRSRRGCGLFHCLVVLAKMTRFDWTQALGGASLDDAIELIRREIHAGCSHSPTKFMSRKRATKRLEEDACIAIAYAYTKLNPDRRYIVRKDWPRAFAIIAKNAEGDGYEAIIEPWLGPDDITNMDGIEPVRVPIEWGKQPASVLARIRNALPWNRPEPAAPLELKEPVPTPTRLVDRDLAPTGYPEGATRKPPPAAPPRPSPKADMLKRADAARPPGKPKPR